jgi:hypothetical protein
MIERRSTTLREAQPVQRDIGWKRPEWTKQRSLRVTKVGREFKEKSSITIAAEPAASFESGI